MAYEGLEFERADVEVVGSMSGILGAIRGSDFLLLNFTKVVPDNCQLFQSLSSYLLMKQLLSFIKY